MVHAFLGVASVLNISGDEVKAWSFRTEEQVNQAMLRVTAEHHFHSNQKLKLYARMRTRLVTAKNDKNKLQDQVRKLETQFTQLQKDKDAKILQLQLEKSRLEGVVASMEKSVTQVIALNTSLKLEKDILDDDRLHD